MSKGRKGVITVSRRPLIHSLRDSFLFLYVRAHKLERTNKKKFNYEYNIHRRREKLFKEKKKKGDDDPAVVTPFYSNIPSRLER